MVPLGVNYRCVINKNLEALHARKKANFLQVITYTDVNNSYCHPYTVIG